MQAITTIGLDIAKSVFQVHGHGRGRQRAHPPSVEAPLRAGVLFKSCHRAWWPRAYATCWTNSCLLLALSDAYRTMVKAPTL